MEDLRHVRPLFGVPSYLTALPTNEQPALTTLPRTIWDIGRLPRPCATPPSRRSASSTSGGTEGPTRGQNKKAAAIGKHPYPWQIKHPLARHLVRALVGASIRCLSHKTCQQDCYKNKVEGNLQRDQIRSMARIVHSFARDVSAILSTAALKSLQLPGRKT
jgi:hypothetical protein